MVEAGVTTFTTVVVGKFPSEFFTTVSVQAKMLMVIFEE